MTVNERSLGFRQKVLGPDHPTVGQSSTTWPSCTKTKAATPRRSLHKRALAILEKVLGPEHPSVAHSLENYAALLREAGRTAKADRMETRAKAIRAN